MSRITHLGPLGPACQAVRRYTLHCQCSRTLIARATPLRNSGRREGLSPQEGRTGARPHRAKPGRSVSERAEACKSAPKRAESCRMAPTGASRNRCKYLLLTYFDAHINGESLFFVRSGCLPSSGRTRRGGDGLLMQLSNIPQPASRPGRGRAALPYYRSGTLFSRAKPALGGRLVQPSPWPAGRNVSLFFGATWRKPAQKRARKQVAWTTQSSP